MLFKRRLMRSSLRGMLSIYEGIIFFAILIGMCKRYLYVFPFHVNNGI